MHRSPPCAHTQGPLSWLKRLWRLLDPHTPTEATDFIERSQHQTELRLANTAYVVDTKSRVITRNGRQFVQFDQIQTVDVTHLREDGDSPERWRVQLNTGLLSCKTLLVTTDDADASILAARLSTLTGKRVRSL
jgi:hypothetical protein